LDFNLIYNSNFAGNIWKIYPDDTFPWLILEIRNYDTRTVSFACFDLLQEQFLWEDLVFNETWWIGIEDVHQGHVLFHHFQDTQFSNHKGIICFEILTQQVKWQRNDLAFYRLLEAEVIAILLDKPEDTFISLDVFDGKIKLDHISVAETQLKAINFEIQRKSNMYFPDIYYQEDINFEKINQYLNRKQHVFSEKMIEYLEFEGYIIISYYLLKSDNNFANHLLILNNEGKINSHFMIDDELKGVGQSTFFIFESKLILVKHKKELCIYDL
jgi:hypothetical protein